MLIVGITGGIGCGKSTVLAEFSKLGVPCFEADAVASRYYDSVDFCAQVADLLHAPHVLLPDGHIDKRTVAAIVFSDLDKLSLLNSLIHPRVLADFHQFVLDRHDSKYCLFESAILYDYGFDRHMDRVIGVYLDFDERISRLQLRDHASREQILARMRNQLPAEQLLSRADFVVLNYEGNPRSRQVAHIHQQLLALSIF